MFYLNLNFMEKKKLSEVKVAAPLFFRAANDAIYALNVVYCATGSAEILKLCSELDLEFKSIAKSISDGNNPNSEDKSAS